MRYSFHAIEQARERPTTPVPAYRPTDDELRRKLAEVEQQVAGLMRRREAILAMLAGQL